MPKRHIFVAVLLAVSLLAGCGGSGGPKDRLSHDEYLQKLRELEAGTDARSASQLFFKLVLDDPVLPKSACVANTREFDRSLRNVVDGVAALHPPSSEQALQDRFVAAARESIKAVDEALDDVEHGALSCGQPLNRRIYGLPSTQRAEEVLLELRKRGYQLGSNSE